MLVTIFFYIEFAFAQSDLFLVPDLPPHFLYIQSEPAKFKFIPQISKRI